MPSSFNPAQAQAYAKAFVEFWEYWEEFRKKWEPAPEPDPTPPEGADLPPLHWDHVLVQVHDEIAERLGEYKKHPAPSGLVPGKIEGLQVALRVIEKHLPKEERRDI